MDCYTPLQKPIVWPWITHGRRVLSITRQGFIVVPTSTLWDAIRKDSLQEPIIIKSLSTASDLPDYKGIPRTVSRTVSQLRRFVERRRVHRREGSLGLTPLFPCIHRVRWQINKEKITRSHGKKSNTVRRLKEFYKLVLWIGPGGKNSSREKVNRRPRKIS